MAGKLTQPKVEHYIHWLKGNDHFGMYGCLYDEKSNALLNKLFDLLEQVSPIAKNGARTLWLRAERGPIEDYGNAAQLIEDGEFESEEEFIASWKSYFPDEVEWYEFSAVRIKDEGYRAVMLAHEFVIVQDNRREPSRFPNEIPEFVQWLLDGVEECIAMLKEGTYNDFVERNLPPQHRTGTIRRKDFWDVWPSARTDFFKDISAEDVEEFIRTAALQAEDRSSFDKRIPTMTVNNFFRFCAMGYAENHYDGCEKTHREQYYLHADGRDEGLGEVSPDDPAAFQAWLHDREKRGGHPWEVCRGGNSTHISLYVMQDEKGFFLYLAGDAWNRTIETVKFYLALTRAGVPVYLGEARTLVARLTEEEKIGIVPEGIIPAYCGDRFPDEHIIDFMNLPYEDREKFLPYCTWYKEQPVTLIKQEHKRAGEL